MPPDENIHQENHFSQDAERLNSLDLNCVKKKIYFKSLFGGSYPKYTMLIRFVKGDVYKTAPLGMQR